MSANLRAWAAAAATARKCGVGMVKVPVADVEHAVTEIATLRSDLARATAERDSYAYWRAALQGRLDQEHLLEAQLGTMRTRSERMERDVARLTAERDAAHAALSGRTVSCVCGGDVERLRMVAEAARAWHDDMSDDEYTEGCDCAACGLITALAALDGAR